MNIQTIIDNHPGFTSDYLNSILYVTEWNGSYYPYDELPHMLYIVRLKHNYYSKLCRMINHIKYAYLRSNYTYFLTLTFNDNYLHLGESKNISRMIKTSLSSFKYYIYNKDYGSTTNRVHYHCLIFSDVEINSISWKYGFYNLKPILNNRFSSVSHYILKYSCHELKCKTKTYYSFKGYDVIKENTIRNFFKQLDNDKIYDN